jgi:two-component system, NarL family, invasion response regulator UvrY
MKILLCDDHPVVTSGLRNVLSQFQDIESVEETHTFEQALLKITSNKPDVIVLDLSLPDINGIDAIHIIKEKFPDVHVLVLSMHPVDIFALSALQAGALCYMNKKTDTSLLINAIRRVAKGIEYLTPEVEDMLTKNHFIAEADELHKKLSKKQYEVMILLAKEKTYREIAKEQDIKTSTVGTYRTEIMLIMKMKKNAELTRYCNERKLI